MPIIGKYTVTSKTCLASQGIKEFKTTPATVVNLRVKLTEASQAFELLGDFPSCSFTRKQLLHEGTDCHNPRRAVLMETDNQG